MAHVPVSSSGDRMQPRLVEPTAFGTIIFIAFHLSLLVVAIWVTWDRRTRISQLRHRHSRSGFPLMKLPPEIRAMVYKEVILWEQSRPTSTLTKGNQTTASGILASASAIIAESFSRPPNNTTTSLLCTSKSVHEEVLHSLCFNHPVRLTVDTDRTDGGTLFTATKDTLRRIHAAQVRISITPNSILPLADLQAIEWRNLAASVEWAQKAVIVDRLNAMSRLKTLKLTIIATGNVHANPVWLWHYVCEALLDSLSTSHLREADCQLCFQIEQMPILRPNDLDRSIFSMVEGGPNGKWQFVCRNQHTVRPYPENTSDVRRFAEGLVAGCSVEGCMYRELR